jgi:release factor glutamine methyltransferase
MKISDILAQAKGQLENSGVSSSRLDSLILLSHAFFLCGLPFSKEQVIFNPDLKLDLAQQQSFFDLVKRRCNREPISHIIGRREFYGRDFIVNKDVLDPRPDSESLIELVLEKFPQKNQPIRILEIGSGSGCLIITLLKELSGAQAITLDISETALAVCKKNADLHKVRERLQILHSDVFSAFQKQQILKQIQDNGDNEDSLNHHPEVVAEAIDNPSTKFNLIISNPPYIDSETITTLQPEVRLHEPITALDGGIDGLDFYRRIALEAESFLCKNGKIILEIGFGQKEGVEKIFIKNGFSLEEVKKDLAGIERALCFAK